MDQKYFSTSEIADMLEVNRYTVSLWIDHGDMKALVTPGGHKKVSREEVIRFIKTRGGSLPPYLELEKGKTMVLNGVNFETGSATLTPGSDAVLERAFFALTSNPQIRIEIVGYTDNVGDQRSNQRLSLRRAEAVSSWLVRKGIGTTRIVTVGMGPLEPLAPNTTPEGRAKNRRIEFHVR